MGNDFISMSITKMAEETLTVELTNIGPENKPSVFGKQCLEFRIQ